MHTHYDPHLLGMHALSVKQADPRLWGRPVSCCLFVAD